MAEMRRENRGLQQTVVVLFILALTGCLSPIALIGTLAAVLPKRQAFFTSIGLRSSTVVSLEEASVDDRCVLVRAQWNIAFEAAGAAVDVSSTYLLQQHPDGLRIVFQLDHDDLTKRVQQLGLAPADNR